MTSFRRRLALYSILAACVGLAIWVVEAGDKASSDRAAAIQAATITAPKIAVAAPAPFNNELPLDRLSRTFVAVDDTDPFAVKSWAPPLPAPAQAPVITPPAPTVPPLPFTFAGKLELDGGKWLVYLVNGEQSFAASQGEIFDGVYRLDGIDHGNLVITYLPMTSKQLLPIGTEMSE